jgi:ABC-2 type transport system ATP-binding protein
LIEVRELRKRYGSSTAVDALSFTVSDGHVTGFLGPNGAGKTTTLRILLGLVHATSGSARIDGRSYHELEAPARHVGAVLEATNFHPKRTGRDHLRVLCAATGIHESRIESVLENVGIANAADRVVGGYSLGMRQRLSVAGALLGDPQLLVLDEPANGLDPEGIRWLRDLLRAFVSDGRTVFISSHVLAEVQQIADEVVIIHRGRLVAQQAVADLTANAVASTRVRSPDAARLRAALVGEGFDVDGDGDHFATSAPPPRVGELAAANGVVLHELAQESASLEEAFLALTGEGGGG